MSSKKNHGDSAPVPPANRPQAGPPGGETGAHASDAAGNDGFHEQDEQRRLGGYETKGEHSLVQPSPLNDGAHDGHGGRSKE